MIITLENSHGRKALLLPMLCLFISINQLTHKKHSSKLRRNIALETNGCWGFGEKGKKKKKKKHNRLVIGTLNGSDR